MIRLVCVHLLIALAGAFISIGSRNQAQDHRAYIVPPQTNTSTSEASDTLVCEGNRLEAIENGRQCLKKCHRDSWCENSRKQCLCDGLCGLSCIRPDSTCPELPPVPSNGRYSPLTNTFNSKIVYTCDKGFFLFGAKERTCQGDEEWSGTASDCLRERKYASCLLTALASSQSHLSFLSIL